MGRSRYWGRCWQVGTLRYDAVLVCRVSQTDRDFVVPCVRELTFRYLHLCLRVVCLFQEVLFSSGDAISRLVA